jgi:hypothetical protein
MEFPIAVLDFEASSLSPHSYPIEVGVAIAVAAADKPLSVWSSLICRDKAWVKSGDWDPASQQVHGIALASLDAGEPAKAVLEALNLLLGPIGHVYCDGGFYDGMWFEKLYQAAGIIPSFALRDMSRLFLRDRPLFDRFGVALRESEPPHRAAADATRLCLALMRATE